MKLLFTFCFFTSIILGQSNNDSFQSIKKQFSITTELKEKDQLTEQEIPYSCEVLSIEGLVTYYYNDDDLELIIHSYAEGHHTSRKSYYVKDQFLFFYFAEEQVNNDTSTYDKETGALLTTEEHWNTSETRVYFNNDKAIKCLTKQYNNITATDEIRDKYENLSDHFKNKEIVCDPSEVKKIQSTYSNLVKLIKEDKKNTCSLHM